MNFKVGDYVLYRGSIRKVTKANLPNEYGGGDIEMDALITTTPGLDPGFTYPPQGAQYFVTYTRGLGMTARYCTSLTEIMKTANKTLNSQGLSINLEDWSDLIEDLFTGKVNAISLYSTHNTLIMTVVRVWEGSNDS